MNSYNNRENRNNNFVRKTLENLATENATTKLMNTHERAHDEIIAHQDDALRYSKFSPFRKDYKSPSPYPKPIVTTINQPIVTTPSTSRTDSNNNVNMRRKLSRIICNNCGVQGHQTYNCVEPIQSYGLLIFDPTMKKVLMVQRKDSYGLMSLVCNERIAKNNIAEIAKTITVDEQQKILCYDFSMLWHDLINNFKLRRNTSIMNANKDRYSDYRVKDIVASIEPSILALSPSWGFPKGRIKKREKWIDCAIREAMEETNIISEDIEIISDMPFMENIKGYDGRMYINVYYMARVKESSFDNLNICPQKEEINNIEWVEYDNLENFLTETTSDLKSLAAKKKLLRQLSRSLALL